MPLPFSTSFSTELLPDITPKDKDVVLKLVALMLRTKSAIDIKIKKSGVDFNAPFSGTLSLMGEIEGGKFSITENDNRLTLTYHISRYFISVLMIGFMVVPMFFLNFYPCIIGAIVLTINTWIAVTRHKGYFEDVVYYVEMEIAKSRKH